MVIPEPIGGKTVNAGDSILACWVDLDTTRIYFHDKYLNPLCEYIVDRLVSPMDLVFISDMTFVPPNKLAGTGMIAILSQGPPPEQDPPGTSLRETS